VGDFVAKKALGAPEARKRWCKCADELGEMVSQEVKTNPRYKGKSLDVRNDSMLSSFKEI
jgi:hypothetical protein